MKIILITGFLGAGKTRFIKTLVEKTTKSIVILENEFGDLNLDGEFLKNNNNNQDDIKVWELTNGCICCSTNLDFTHSILTIANTINPEFLIIEPSGVAKVKNIIEKIKVISYERIELGLPILIIDSKNLDNIFNNYSEYLDDELKYNGLVAVSKSESMTDQQFLKIKSELNINNKSVFPLAHYSKWEDDIWEYIFNTSGTIEKIGNELSLRLKVNKNKIEMHCHGKCQLKKDIQTSSENTAKIINLKDIDIVLVAPLSFEVKEEFHFELKSTKTHYKEQLFAYKMIQEQMRPPTC